MEDDARAIILRLVFGDDEQDGWKLLVDTARRWNAFLAENPPSDEDDTFFSGSFIAENPRRKQVKPKKVRTRHVVGVVRVEIRWKYETSIP